MDWNPTFFFDREPNWERLAGLHPDYCLLGQQNRNGKLWRLDLTNDDLPPEFHSLQLSAFPCEFEWPANISIPHEYIQFVERIGAVTDLTGALPIGVLRLCASIAFLSGVRTLAMEDPWASECAMEERRYDLTRTFPGFDFACLMRDGAVEAFGATCPAAEIVLNGGEIEVTCDCARPRGGESMDIDIEERLSAFPYVRLKQGHRHREQKPNLWPRNMWPLDWGDFDTMLGIDESHERVACGWRDSFYRPSRNAPGTIATMFQFVCGRPFANTGIGRLLARHGNRDSGDEED